MKRRIKPYLMLNKRYLSTVLRPKTDSFTCLPIAWITPVRPTSLLDSCTNLISLKKLHGLLVVHGSHHFLPIQTKLVSSYGSLGDTESARKLFDGIPDPDLYSWKVMLRWYVLNERFDEAIGFYREMRCCLREEDDVVFSLVLKSCIKLLDFDEGKKIHCQIVKIGDPDCFVLNSLIDMYAKSGDMECAHKVFDQIHDGNVVTWTSIICGYIQNKCAEQGLVLFNEMRRVLVKPSEYTMGSLLTACSMLDALHQGKWIHGCVIKYGFGLNSYVGTAILDMYVKCGKFIDARHIFDGLYNADIVAWTAMIVGYTQKGLPLEALRLFSDKKWSTMVPNSVTIASVLSASAQLQNLNLGRSIHMLGIKLGVEEFAVVMNALVDMYAKCCAISEASRIFKRIEKKDIVTWNSMIAGYSQNDLGYQALLLFNQMMSYGCSPDAITVVSALSACASLGALHIGSSFHVYAVKHFLLSNIYISTALLNFYNKCGDAISARKVFDEMSDHNTVSWCAMLDGYGVQGDSISYLDLFNKMLKEELQPNDVTFTSILSTCSHTGLICEGKKYFDSMTHHYNIVPSMKHYACMVDMLARAGELEEALQFIEKMPMQADFSVWGAFIHGCRLHSRLELGEVAIRRMMELQPETPDYYVLMSNLYTSFGRWSEALAVRGLMKGRGLVKLPGCSSVGMENG
ncbi:pentatricopeptide repeat-containing protein At2g03380, mitochondrial [Typha angustifolia]|uniref:pentatricopeptide repeat-containing protein At2g03380, mitochondrial n=1 Tax=Typha angustifolia TaxID=59011 RepID=UPI003C2AF06C